MRYRSIDHSRVSWGRQCPVNCIKCATSTLGRRIDFVTLPGESDFMAKRADLIASIKTTFISPGETLSSSKGKPAPRRGTYVHDEKFRTIFCKINERPCCSSLSGPWLVLDQTRRPIDHVPRFTRLLTLHPRTCMYTIRWTSYNSGCPMKKQRRYPFAKHKLVLDRRTGGFATRFRTILIRFSTILHRNCRVGTLIIRYLANVSRRNLEIATD